MSLIDLHCHSTASDGHLTPTALVEHAAAGGVTTMALTDHDTVEGLDEAVAAGARLGVRVLSGIELTVQVPHGSMHLLAYLPTTRPEALIERMARQTELRTERIRMIVDRLAEIGVPVDWDRVRARAAGQMGRPHVAHEMVHAGHVDTVQEAFDRYLADGGPAHVPNAGLEPHDTLSLVRQVGGVPVLAHPASLRLPARHLQSFVQSLAARGLQGIEVHRPEHTAEQRDSYGAIAKRLRLIPAGGSDFHKPDGPFLIGDTGTPPLAEASVERILSGANLT